MAKEDPEFRKQLKSAIFKSGLEIRNIRYNLSKGYIYGEVYVDGELELGATLTRCIQRVELLSKERLDKERVS